MRAKEASKVAGVGEWEGRTFLLVGVASRDCSYAPSGAYRDFLGEPRAEARG